MDQIDSADLQAHIRTLAAEYVALVELMRTGQFVDDDEYRALSSQRSLIHDELIALTGITERPAMYGYCRALLHARPPHADS